jgi:hypothetical protein
VLFSCSPKFNIAGNIFVDPVRPLAVGCDPFAKKGSSDTSKNKTHDEPPDIFEDKGATVFLISISNFVMSSCC